MSIVFGKNVTNTYFAQIVWVNLVLGHGVHISEEKNWILLTRRKRTGSWTLRCRSCHYQLIFLLLVNLIVIEWLKLVILIVI